MSWRTWSAGVGASCALVGSAVLALGLIQPAAAGGDPERGAYLAQIMDCGGCHTPGALAGQPDESAALSGSAIGFAIPNLGIFYPPNLTSDRETGLGDWSAAEIIRAVREGVRPDGRELIPAMPWRAYAVLTDTDAADLAAYLKSLPARTHQVPGPFGPAEAVTAPYLTVVVPKTN